MVRRLKNFDRLSDNKHQIDLLSLNDFLLEKGDKLLNYFISDNNFRNLEDITKEDFHSIFTVIFPGGNVNSGLGFVGDDFPADWYNKKIVNYILSHYFFYKYEDIKILFNKELFGFYKFHEILITKNPFYLKHTPKDVENYYDLVKIAYAKTSDIVNEEWFPKEYIPQLIKDFPEDSEGLKTYLLKEYISREVKKLLREAIYKKENF
jgi:hypothetical protein